MKYLRRLIFQMLLVLATIICATTMTFWILSYQSNQWILSLESPPRLYEVQSRQGYLSVAITRGWPGMQMLGFNHYADFSTPPKIRRFAGVTVFETPTRLAQIYSPTAQDLGMTSGDTIAWPQKPSRLSTLTITVPYWEPALVSGFPVLAMLLVKLRRAWRSRTRARDGFCAKCGYDLRASKDRCPECGTPKPTTAPR